MPWSKDSEEYEGWRRDLLSAEDPYDFIKSIVDDKQVDGRANILACFADTMKETGEEGSPAEKEKFREVANALYGDEASRVIAVAFDIGDWNSAFREDPEKTISDLVQRQDFNPEFRTTILENFSQIAEEEQLDSGIKARLAGINPNGPQQDGLPQAAQERDDEPQLGGQQQQAQFAARDGDEIEDEISVAPRQRVMLDRGRGDPITEAIRDQVLKAQREVIAAALVNMQGVDPRELDTLEKFRNFSLSQANAGQLEAVFANPDVKAELDRRTLAGQQNVLLQFSDSNLDPHFSPIAWDGPIITANQPGVVIKSQVVRDEDGNPLYTLQESTKTFTPTKTVKNSQGNDVTVRASRIVDMPEGNGDLGNDVTMHLSLVLKDVDGNSPPKNKAVRFTAEYENGKLVEMSCPQPVKFTSDAPDAMGYIEHNGSIYTIPVTKEKYDSMMRTIAQNKGQSQAVNLSQNMDGSMMDGRGGVDGQYERQEQYQEHEAQVYQVYQGPYQAQGEGEHQQQGPFPNNAVQDPSNSQVEQNDVEPLQPQPSQVRGDQGHGGEHDGEGLPAPRPSVSSSMDKKTERAALDAALTAGNISELLDRLQVNKENNTVTLKGVDGGEDIVLKASTVREYLAEPAQRQAAQAASVMVGLKLNEKIEEVAPFDVKGVSSPSAAAASKMAAKFNVKVVNGDVAGGAITPPPATVGKVVKTDHPR